MATARRPNRALEEVSGAAGRAAVVVGGGRTPRVDRLSRERRTRLQLGSSRTAPAADLFPLYPGTEESLRTERCRASVRPSVATMSAATASIADVSRTDFTNKNDRNKSGKTDEMVKRTVSDSCSS